MSTWLLVLLILLSLHLAGMVVAYTDFRRMHTDKTLEDGDDNIIYGLMILCWEITFIAFWRDGRFRKQSEGS